MINNIVNFSLIIISINSFIHIFIKLKPILVVLNFVFIQVKHVFIINFYLFLTLFIIVINSSFLNFTSHLHNYLIY